MCEYCRENLLYGNCFRSVICFQINLFLRKIFFNSNNNHIETSDVFLRGMYILFVYFRASDIAPNVDWMGVFLF